MSSRKRKARTLPVEIFLSHSIKDKRFLKRLVAVLRDHGLSVWFSEHGIRGAAQWHDEIGAALSQIQTIDFIGRFDDACRELFAIWGIAYRKDGSQ
jgi:TIR domain